MSDLLTRAEKFGAIKPTECACDHQANGHRRYIFPVSRFAQVRKLSRLAANKETYRMNTDDLIKAIEAWAKTRELDNADSARSNAQDS